MKSPLRLVRALSLGAALLVMVQPGAAGERETAYIRSLAGEYAGSGTLSVGRERTRMTCTLSVSSSASDLSFSSSCGGGRGTSGTVAYDEGNDLWVATSDGSRIEARRNGKWLSFTKSDRDGNGSSTTTFVFAPDGVTLRFRLQLTDGIRGSGEVEFHRR